MQTGGWGGKNREAEQVGMHIRGEKVDSGKEAGGMMQKGQWIRPIMVLLGKRFMEGTPNQT